MTPKDLIQGMVDDLERKSPDDVTDVAVKIEHTAELAVATVAKFIDGQWQMFKVVVQPIGFSESLSIGA